MSNYSRTLASFTQPAVNGFVAVTVTEGSTDWMVAGLPVYCENGGFYRVFNVTSDSTAILRNLGYSDENAAVGATISANSKIVAAGLRGVSGLDGIPDVPIFYSATDPNGSVTAERPAICYSDTGLYFKTNTGLNDTGWTQIIT